jgi:hypothetical protein
MSNSTPDAATGNPGRVYSIIGIVCGAVALLFIPILFGPAGIILGFVGYSKGDKPLGLWVGIGSVVTMIVGMILGAIVWNASN